VGEMLTHTRTTLVSVAVAVVVATALSAATEPATAKTSVCNPGCGGRAASKPKKNHMLIVRDKRKDVLSAVAEFQLFDRQLNEWLGAGRALYWNSRGSDARAKRYRLRLDTDFGLPDGNPVRYRACTADREEWKSEGSAFFDCGGWRSDKA
jgi:hypothetical protein